MNFRSFVMGRVRFIMISRVMKGVVVSLRVSFSTLFVRDSNSEGLVVVFLFIRMLF